MNAPARDCGDAAPQDWPAPQPPATADDVPAPEFAQLLHTLGACLAVSTYQANRLIVLQPRGDRVAASSYPFERPMGIAADAQRLVVGTMREIQEFHTAAAASRQDAAGPDSVYRARRSHVTGQIDIHEMAWDGGGDLWFVNTLFSCLCTLDGKASFVPRWRPRFISHYAAEDRCHLNGLAMREGLPRHVTALGETDTCQGWRANRRDGGVLIDVATQQVLARGLCMPHSPRWHDSRLWLLESGLGALCTVDPASGAREEVVRLPGFCRGIDFVGPVAFVGLSQPRDSNSFVDLPSTADNEAHRAGIWAVHLRSGEILGRFTFPAGLREVFAVQAVAGGQHVDLVQEGTALDTACAVRESGLALCAAPRPPS